MEQQLIVTRQIPAESGNLFVFAIFSAERRDLFGKAKIRGNNLGAKQR